MLYSTIFFFIIITLIFYINNYNIEHYTNYKYMTFEIDRVYRVGNIFETKDLNNLLKNKLKLKQIIYNNSTEILNDINNNKLDFGIIYDNFLDKKYNNIKKISYINYSSHLLLTYNNNINSIINLKNKNVCLGLKNSNSYKIGIKLFNLLNININIIIPKNEEQLFSDFNSNKFDALYVNTLAPNFIINKLNINNLYFIDITKNIDRNLLYRINLLKNKNDKYLIYKNNSTINNPSNNIWLVSNTNTNPKIISNIINILLSLKHYKIKIGKHYLNFKNLSDIIIDDNEAKHRNLIKKEKLLNSFYYNTDIDYHNTVIDKYYDLGYITDKKNINCISHYKHSRC